MKSGSRDEAGTRLHAEQQFREGEIQILVATEAAGEGPGLQRVNSVETDQGRSSGYVRSTLKS
jgi:superfamily II DNA/RNA helicase